MVIFLAINVTKKGRAGRLPQRSQAGGLRLAGVVIAEAEIGRTATEVVFHRHAEADADRLDQRYPLNRAIANGVGDFTLRGPQPNLAGQR